MDQHETHTLEELLRRYSSIEKLPEVRRIKFDEAVRTGEDPLSIVRYFATLGIAVREPADLFRLNDDPNEEEINAFKIPEGVAVSVESDDLWLVFEVDSASMSDLAEMDGTETVSSASTASNTPSLEGNAGR
ncbi:MULTISPECIES: hypothetical protein [unclassified Acidocella]|uniref:hypothetical protein n=1 Tax=unclassified Acidocella TaxID=2648610 RepID=UPI00028CC14B|nr:MULTISPECIES: hypothetical protein [unclassified Acidocella]EKM99387.1 hypothetical protein MXAZACID_10618 [Acidocella sp. MX-AZ02]WBO58044.1 hypothetical protein GT370_12310 [Acidocella sp. MX-AZ03]